MAIYHIKPLTGNDANSGLSEALAKQSYKVLLDSAVIVSGDTVILYNESDTEHLVNFTGAANVTIPLHFLTIQPSLDTDGNFVKLRVRRDINNSLSYVISGFVMNRIDFIIDQNNINVNNAYRCAGGGTYTTYSNCKISTVNNTTANSVTPWTAIFQKGSSAQSIAYKTDIIGDNLIPLGSISASYRFSSCNFYNHKNTNAAASSYAVNLGTDCSVIRCKFWNLTAPSQTGANTTSNRRALIAIPNGYGTFIQNTIISDQADVAGISLNLDASTSSKAHQLNNNIFYNTVTSTTGVLLIVEANAINYAQDMASFIGYNFHNFSNKLNAGASGITWRAGNNVTLTTNPFLSLVDTHPDFLKLNPALTECPGQGLAGSSPGAIETTIGGGSLLPVGDVKIGVDRGDGQLGTYDGSDRWSDAGESNVKFGVQYKANSLTNNKTGNRTDANPINVKTGTGQYGANGTEFTPSYSPDFASPSNVLENDTTDGVTGTIPLSAVKATSGGTLPLNKIAPSQGGSYLGEESNDAITAAELKIGLTKQNLSNTINGTYDAIERYTDLDLSKVDSTYSFRFNSLTNNRTGTQVFYPLLAVNKVAIGQDRGDGNLGTYDASERYTDLDLNKIVAGYAFRHNSLVDNRTGARTAIYDLLNPSVVKFNVDRGDGTLGTDKGEDFNTVLTADKIKVDEVIQNLGNTITGTYTASERYTDIDLSQVTFGYAFRFNSLTNNRTGARTAIYPLLPLNKVESGTDRGDGQLGTNKGEAFNSVLTPSLIKVGESIENLGETILGDYTASERYTQLLPEEVQNNKEYIYNNEPFTGTLTGGSIDPKYILTPFGTLGEINLSSMDYAKQARNQFLTVMSANLTGWKQADYLELDGLTKNSNVQNAKRYGIRILGNEIIDGTAGVIGREVVSREFEIVLTDSFINNQTTDIKARDCQDKIIEEMERVRRFINSTNFGLFSVPRIITDISENDCEFIDENNTIICRMRLKVQLKLNKS